MSQFLQCYPNIIKEDDWDSINESLKDGIFTRNIEHYLKEWLKYNLTEVVREFHNSKSDANPMEDETQERYFRNLQQWIDNK